MLTLLRNCLRGVVDAHKIPASLLDFLDVKLIDHRFVVNCWIAVYRGYAADGSGDDNAPNSILMFLR